MGESLAGADRQVWFPLFCRSTFSLLRGLPRTEDFPAAIGKAGYPGCALADFASVGGVPTFVKGMKKAGLKPLAGCEFPLISSYQREEKKGKKAGVETFSTALVLARNQEGWKKLMRAVSEANEPSRYFRRPALTLEHLADLNVPGGWLVFMGRPNSLLASSLFSNPRLAFLGRTKEEVEAHLRPDAEGVLRRGTERHLSLFGESLQLEVTLTDPDNLPVQTLLAERVRELGQRYSLPVVATADTHYFSEDDAPDQRLLVASHLKTTLGNVQRNLAQDDDVTLSSFFRSSKFYLPSLGEMRGRHAEGELRRAVDVAALCEPPDVGSSQLVPVLELPPGVTGDDRIREMCREGWKRKVQPALNRLPTSLRTAKKEQYAARVKMELDVLSRANFSMYFLIVEDYIRYARKELKSLVGPGRGSSAGSLVAFLLDITRVDPIEYGLLFERFINAGRLQFPDIDTDFEPSVRAKIMEYLRRKYGADCVAPMCNFSCLSGRSALKKVLRAHGGFHDEELNRITKPVPDEAAITDDLQEARDQLREASVIRWALENVAEELREWCFIGKDGSLDGPLAPYFSQAIRLEGCCDHLGKHASGVVITPVPVHELCPLIYDQKEGGLMTGFDKSDAEAAGLVKVDILGLKTLGKMGAFGRIVRGEAVG